MMFDVYLLTIVIASVLLEFIVIYYRQRVDAIPIFSSFIPIYIVYKGINDWLLILILSLLAVITFILKEFSINFDASLKLKMYNLISKSLFTLFSFAFAFIFVVLFAKNLLGFIVFYIIFAYFYLILFTGSISGIFEENLKNNIIHYLDEVEKQKKMEPDIKTEVFEKSFLTIKEDKKIFPFKYMFNEYYILVCLSCIFLFSNFLASNEVLLRILLIIVFIIYSFVVFTLRWVYNSLIFDSVKEYFRNFIENIINTYEVSSLKRKLLELKENSEKLDNWLRYLGEFYSKLDENPDYEDLYHSFYSILSKSLNFSRFVIFIPEKEDNIIESMKAVFHRGIGRAEFYLKNTAIEIVVNSLKTVSYFGGTVFSALSLYKDDRSFICTPIKIGNKLIGVVYLSSVNTRSFNEQDVNFVELLCDKFAILYILYKEYSKTRDMSIKDGLTGLYNHRHFQELLSKEVENAKLYGYPVCLLMIDTDKFKQYNDTFGHPMGDELLKNIAKIILSIVGDKGYVCRYGGDEFAVILPNFYKENAAVLAEEIRKAYYSLRRGDIQVAASIGVACFPLDASSKDELIKKADELLYRAKKEGRNRVYVA